MRDLSGCSLPSTCLLEFYLRGGKLTVLSMGLLVVFKTNPEPCTPPGVGMPTLNKCQGQWNP